MTSFKHGGTLTGKRTPEYYSWQSMRARCLNPNHQDRAHYADRGIRVCERWESFANFLADMGPRPFGTSLDRKDNNGNYEPGNCRWATPGEQAANKSVTRLVTVGGETLPIGLWADRYGVDRRVFVRRLARGLSFEQAAASPSNRKRVTEMAQ